MAIGTPVLREVAGSAATSTTTASFTPTANSKLFAWAVAHRDDATATNKPTLSDSVSGTWTEVGSGISFVDTGFAAHGAIYYSEIGASPAARTVTATGSNADRVTLVTFDITGVGTDFSNIATATSTTGDPSLTLSAFSAGGAGLGTAGAVGNNNFTPPTGYTELYDLSPGSLTRRATVVYDLTTPGTTLTWASNNSTCVAMGVELKEAAAATKSLPVFSRPPRFRSAQK